jgi:hypothetical protein
MTKPECRCVVSLSLLAVKHVFSERTHRETVLGRAKPVFHVVGVGREALILLSGEALSLRWRTDMTGRRTSLLATEKGAAALEAHDGTYLGRGEVSLQSRPMRATRS